MIWKHKIIGCLGLVVGLLVQASCSSPPSNQIDNQGNMIIQDSQIGSEIEELGEYTYQVQEYGADLENPLDTRIDPLVSKSKITDLRGIVYLPSHPNDQGPYPLLVFMHGNHGTCGINVSPSLRIDSPFPSFWFHLTGRCSAGMVEAPSYLGYDYLARFMASHGYLVVSINANRGITGNLIYPKSDPFHILARGKLALKHLARLSKWNNDLKNGQAELGLDLRDKIDFHHVGLMGHSRGGEGMRRAYDLYQEQAADTYAKDINDMVVEGIFEFAPVDLMDSEPINVSGTNWAVVIPSCDGDAAIYPGTGVFRRRRIMDELDGFSSVFVVPGAIHNYFNSEWQTPELFSKCELDQTALPGVESPQGSEVQRRVGLMTLSAFFRGFVGSNPDQKYQRVFDPQYHVPPPLAQLIDPIRESLLSENVEVLTQLDSSDGSVGIDYREQIPWEEDWQEENQNAQRKLTQITTDSSSNHDYYDVHLWDDGYDISDQWILSFSIARYEECWWKFSCHGDENPIDLSIQLTFVDGTHSKSIKLIDYISLTNSLNRVRPCAQSIHDQQKPPRGNCIDEMSGLQCLLVGGSYDNKQHLCYYWRQSRYLLFHEVPIELADFDAQDLSQVTGLRFRFDQSANVSLFLDKVFVLRSLEN